MLALTDRRIGDRILNEQADTRITSLLFGSFNHVNICQPRSRFRRHWFNIPKRNHHCAERTESGEQDSHRTGKHLEIQPNVLRPASFLTLEISPRLRGRYVWNSSRSGTFTPDEPLALGTVYRFTLRPGLLNAEGQPSKAALRRTFGARIAGRTSSTRPRSRSPARRSGCGRRFRRCRE